MGTSASCSIVLAPVNKPFYWTGETIAGNVFLTVDRSLKVKSIDANIIGQLTYARQNTGGEAGTETESKIFYVQRLSLIIPPTNGISFDGVSRSCYSEIFTNKTIDFNKVLIRFFLLRYNC